MTNWYPSFEQSVAESVRYGLRRALDLCYSLGARLGAVESGDFVSRKEAAATYGSQAQQAALQASGKSPVNVTGLSGLLSQPQKAYVPYVDALPDVLHDPMSQDGALVSYQGIVYWFDGRTEPGRWVPLGAIGVLLEDTHANRLLNYPPADYPLHSVFYETDRRWFYHNVLVGGVKTWVYLAGNMRAVVGSRPGGLGIDDTNARFWATDWTIQYHFGGVTWTYEIGTYRDVVANRPAFIAPDPDMVGFLFYATDWTILWRWDGNNWVYQEGVYRNTLANIPVGWGAENAGFLFYATDYHHLYRYTGAAWEYAPGDDGSGDVRMYTQAPNSPGVSAWQLCDGSTVGRSNPDGTATLVTLPDLTTAPAQAAFSKLGSPYTGVPVAGSGGVVSGDTGAGTAHDHGVGTLDAAAEDAHTHTGTTDPSWGSTVVLPGPNNASPVGHDHTFTTGAGSSHDHALSGDTATEAAHTHPVGTLAVAAGEPRNLVLLPYFRR